MDLQEVAQSHWRIPKLDVRGSHSLVRCLASPLRRGFYVGGERACGESADNRRIPADGVQLASLRLVLPPDAGIWCKKTSAVGSRRGGLLSLSATTRVGVEGQARQRVEGTGHVEKARVGVDIGGQFRVAVPHRRSRRAERNPALAQERAERMPQRVNVERSAPVITLGNLRGLQIAVEGPQQIGRDVEQRRRVVEARGYGLAKSPRFGPVGEPLPRVGPNRDGGAFAVLFVGRVQFDKRRSAVEPQLSNDEAHQFAPSWPRQNQNLVKQRPLPADGFEVGPNVVADLGDKLALAVPRGS